MAAFSARAFGAGSPYIRDLVLAGDNRQKVAALIFPDLAACRALISEASGPPRPLRSPSNLLADPAVRQKFSEILARLSAEAKGTAERIALAALLPTALARGRRNHR